MTTPTKPRPPETWGYPPSSFDYLELVRYARELEVYADHLEAERDEVRWEVVRAEAMKGLDRAPETWTSVDREAYLHGLSLEVARKRGWSLPEESQG